MKLIASAFVLVSVGSAPVLAADKVSESCAGTETVQVGAQPPKTLPYLLNFSADLSSRLYCYDKCVREQTYKISDAGSNPIKLADVDGAGQTRRLVYNRSTSVLTDYQIIATGPMRIVRNASATCKAAKFQEPWTGGTSQPK